MMKIERYGVYWADLDGPSSLSVANVHPVVVVGHPSFFKPAESVIVCPLTLTRQPDWESRIPFICAGIETEIATDQISTIEQSCLKDRIDKLSPAETDALRALLNQMLLVE
mgnify:FL=1|jgi:mRNA-degrading endonuclease toxin of MazEF toxin-antitoxin module|tara:strand:- start:1400 stop:1732 length:333 start_codon:yes stop_codon:yes gene_type:complete